MIVPLGVIVVKIYADVPNEEIADKLYEDVDEEIGELVDDLRGHAKTVFVNREGVTVEAFRADENEF